MLKDLIASLLLLLVAILYFALSLDINQSALADEVGAAGLPFVFTCALAFLAFALLGKAAVKWAFARRLEVSSSAELGGEVKKLAKAAGMLVIGVGYLSIVSVIGYLLSLTAIIALVAWYQGERVGPRLATIAIAGGVMFFAFFDLVLGVDMPTGFWPSLWGA